MSEGPRENDLPPTPEMRAAYMAGWNDHRHQAHQGMVDEAIAVLNRIHEADPTVMPRLVTTRVPCNETLAEDPTVQVGGERGAAFVGFLGVLNGIFGVQPGSQVGWIAASMDDETGDLIRFQRFMPEDAAG